MKEYSMQIPIMEVTIPDEVTDEAQETIESIIAAIEQLTIEDREYALDMEDLPDDMQAFEDGNDLPYVVHGEKPWADDMAVAVEENGEDIRIAVQWNSRRGHWKEEDHAGTIYDVFEDHGVERPIDNRTVGVQFGSNGAVAVENVIYNATE